MLFLYFHRFKSFSLLFIWDLTIAAFPADLVTFTDEILTGKLHFLCSDARKQRESTKENTKKTTKLNWD